MQRPTIWLLIFQMTGIGSSGPLWALMYLSFSPTIAQSSLRNLQQASYVTTNMPLVIILEIVLGYLLPAVAMILPSPTRLSYDSKQTALILWNIFPLLIFTIQTTLAKVVPNLMRARVLKTGEEIKSRQHLAATRWMYAIALTCSFASHVAILTISFSTVWLPMLWREIYIANLSPARLFMPPVNFSVGQTVGDGVRSFMLWDQVFGYATVGLVMLLQLQNALRSTGRSFYWLGSVLAALLGSIVLGPGSSCLILSWIRDEILFEAPK